MEAGMNACNDGGVVVVALSEMQVMKAVNDYCVAHGLVKPGNYRSSVTTTIGDNKIQGMSIEFQPIPPL